MTPYQKAAVLVLRMLGFFSIAYAAIPPIFLASHGAWLSLSSPFLLVILMPLIGGLLLYYNARQIARLLTRDFDD